MGDIDAFQSSSDNMPCASAIFMDLNFQLKLRFSFRRQKLSLGLYCFKFMTSSGTWKDYDKWLLIAIFDMTRETKKLLIHV